MTKSASASAAVMGCDNICCDKFQSVPPEHTKTTQALGISEYVHSAQMRTTSVQPEVRHHLTARASQGSMVMELVAQVTTPTIVVTGGV